MIDFHKTLRFQTYQMETDAYDDLSKVFQKYGDYYIAKIEGINVFCWGRNVNELKEDIKENLYVLYKNFVDCDKSELTLDAINLRSKLEEFFAEKEEK